MVYHDNIILYNIKSNNRQAGDYNIIIIFGIYKTRESGSSHNNYRVQVIINFCFSRVYVD